MNPIQEAVLDFAKNNDLTELSYYKIAQILGVDHPYKVQFAIEQLRKKGFLANPNNSFISVPYYGEVSCGPAVNIADDRIQGYMKFSRKSLPKDINNLIVLRASGDSMNRANINNKNVDDGDYVLAKRQPIFNNGDYVISYIDGMANLKKFKKNSQFQQIILESESSSGSYLPIVIDSISANEDSYYKPIAKAIDVIKL